MTIDRHGDVCVVTRLFDDFSACAASCMTMTGDEWFARQEPPLPASVRDEMWAECYYPDSGGSGWSPVSLLRCE